MLSPDYNVYMDTQEAINVAIVEAFEGEGIEFAYPTRTIILAPTDRPVAATQGVHITARKPRLPRLRRYR